MAAAKKQTKKSPQSKVKKLEEELEQTKKLLNITRMALGGYIKLTEQSIANVRDSEYAHRRIIEDYNTSVKQVVGDPEEEKKAKGKPKNGEASSS